MLIDAVLDVIDRLDVTAWVAPSDSGIARPRTVEADRRLHPGPGETIRADPVRLSRNERKRDPFRRARGGRPVRVGHGNNHALRDASGRCGFRGDRPHFVLASVLCARVTPSRRGQTRAILAGLAVAATRFPRSARKRQIHRTHPTNRLCLSLAHVRPAGLAVGRSAGPTGHVKELSSRTTISPEVRMQREQTPKFPGFCADLRKPRRRGQRCWSALPLSRANGEGTYHSTLAYFADAADLEAQNPKNGRSLIPVGPSHSVLLSDSDWLMMVALVSHPVANKPPGSCSLFLCKRLGLKRKRRRGCVVHPAFPCTPTSERGSPGHLA
jgi:hypothetical protein